MCKRLVFFVVLLALVGGARADTLFHWTFDGNTPGDTLISDTDIASGAVAYAFINEGGVGDANGLFYGAGNPYYNSSESSADFQNDPCSNNAGYGLAVLDTGVDSDLDLSTLGQVTIECFVQPYLLRQNVIIRKNNSPGDGGIYYIDTRPEIHSYTAGKGVFAIRLVGNGEDTGDHDSVCQDLPYDAYEWYHVALVWDGAVMTFYVNGVQSQELGARADQGYTPGSGVSEVPFTGPIGDSCKALGIGCQDRGCMTDPNSPTNTNQNFCGKIDEVRISDEALSSTELLFYGINEGIASRPRPRNKSQDLCPAEAAELCWTPGKLASSHDVYFGTDSDDVENATTAAQLGVYMGNQEPNCWPTSGIELDTIYYWRIDEVNDSNGATWKGNVWEFTTRDGNNFDPAPADGTKGAPPNDVTLSWTPGCLAASHTLYFGTSENDVEDGTGGTDKGSQSPGYDPGDLGQNTVYHWRVDAVNGPNTWPGPVWSFKTGKGGILVYFDFEGTEGQDLPDPITDNTGSVDFDTYIADGEDAGTVKYGAPNPFYNPAGTSMSVVPEAGIFRNDPNIDNEDILRLEGMAYTIETWMKAESFPSYDDNIIIKKYGTYDVRIGGDGDQVIRWAHEGGGTLEAPDKVKRNEWYHIAAVFDSTADPSRTLYVDGVAVDTGTASPLPADHNDPVSIGFMRRPSGTSDDFFEGQIDELAILDIPLGPGTFLFFPGPDYASNPYPAKGAIRVDPNVVLTWTPGSSADNHDVYFGTDPNAVQANDASVYEGNFGPNEFDPCGPGNPLILGQTYYWRVNEQGAGGPWNGLVWSFTIQSPIVDVNMVAWYKLDESEGTTAEDSSGYDQHADVDADDPDWDPLDGRWDGSLGFDDDTDVECPDGPEGVLGNISDGISISLWLKDAWRDDETNWVFGTGTGSSVVQAAVVDEPNRDVYFRAGNDTNDVITWDLDDANPRTIDGWHMWTFVKNETSGEISIYFDGFVAESNDVVDATLSDVSGDQLRFGVARSSSNSFIGRIDDARVFNKGLSAQEVAALFRGGEVELAWAPDPFDGEQEVPSDANLTWQPGDYAVQHDVYLGTDWDDVNDANTTSAPIYRGRDDPCEYDPPISFEMGQTYYWRIDEVNDPNIWKGKVWTFTTADYITIDNFEQYNDDNKIEDTWEDGTLNWTGALVYCVAEPFSPVHGGYQSMQYLYDNRYTWGPGYYSEAALPFDPPMDFTTNDATKVLTLYFYGAPDNDINDTEQMYVGLGGSYAEIRYTDDAGRDMNDLRLEEWSEWNIPISDFNDPDVVDPCAVTSLLIGFGDRDNTSTPGGGGWDPVALVDRGLVFFDDIRLYPPRCVPEKRKPAADLSYNCIVDWADVAIIGSQWLRHDANLNPVQDPTTTNLVGHWELDGDATDSSVNANHGTLIGDTAWITGRIGSGAIEFIDGEILVPDGNATPELRPANEVTAAAWAYYSTGQDNSNRIVVKGADNAETYGLEINDDDQFVSYVRDVNGDQYNNESGAYRNEWMHLALTYDGASVKSYRNGEEVGTRDESNLDLSQDTAGFAIGDRSDANNRRFEGNVDDVRVYNRGLTAGEIGYLASDGTGEILLDSVANLYVDAPDPEVINLKDIARLLETWLEEKLWPE